MMLNELLINIPFLGIIYVAEAELEKERGRGKTNSKELSL